MAIYDFIRGSSEPVIVQLHQADDTTGTAGIDLTGATSMSAVAKHTDSGATVSLTAAVNNAATGKVQLSWSASAFDSAGAGVYDVQITFTQAGSTRKYPSDGTGLRFNCHEAN